MPVERKTTQVHIRLTLTQHAELEEASRHLGVPLSTWMLMVALKEARLSPACLADKSAVTPTLVDAKAKPASKTPGRKAVLIDV